MQVRFARHTGRPAELLHFYRDGLGLPEIGRFENHDGYNGLFLDLPGSNGHLEFTSGGENEPPVPHVESLLVIYLGDDRALAAIRKRVPGQQVEAANPYWRRHGVTLLDPDGFPVVLVPEAWP